MKKSCLGNTVQQKGEYESKNRNNFVSYSPLGSCYPSGESNLATKARSRKKDSHAYRWKDSFRFFTTGIRLRGGDGGKDDALREDGIR